MIMLDVVRDDHPPVCPHCGCPHHVVAWRLSPRAQQPLLIAAWGEAICCDCASQWRYTLPEVTHAGNA